MIRSATGGPRTAVALGAVVVLLGSLTLLAFGPDDDHESTQASKRGSTTSTAAATTTATGESTSSTALGSTTPSPVPGAGPVTTAAGRSGLVRPVVFARNTAQAFEVWLMEADGSAQRRIDTYSQPSEAVAASCGATWPIAHKLRDWSPDGQRFFVIDECTRSGAAEAQLYDRAGRKLQRVPLTAGSGNGDTDAAWSPDGTQFVAGDENVTWVTIIDVATGRLVRKIEGLATHYLGWAPANRIVMMGIDVPGQRAGLLTLNPDGSDRRFVAGAQFQGRPQWSRDGSILFRHRAPGDVVRVGVAPDRADAPVTPICGGDAGDFDWAPDGRTVVAAVLGGDVPQVTVCPLDGGPGRTVGRGVNVTFDSQGRILFVRDGATWLVAPDGSGLRRLAAGGPPMPAPN